MTASESPIAQRSRTRRLITTLLSVALGAAIMLTSSGAQSATASAELRTAEGSAVKARSGAGARSRAFWPYRFTVTGSLDALGVAISSVGGSIEATDGDEVAVRITYETETDLAAIRASFAARGLTLERVRRYTIDAVRPQPDGSREAGWLDQWSLFGPQMRNAYNVPYGIDMMSTWKLAKGSGSVVAVLDTGILAGHPDLARARFAPGYDFVCYGTLTDCNDNDTSLGSDTDPSDPGDWCLDDGDGASSSWHGTHVTGTIAAQLNKSGIAGIAPETTILPVRVLGQCGGSDADINAAIRWAAGLSVPAGANGQSVPTNAFPADVINLSLGGWGECDVNTSAAIRAARAAGAVVVVSAGNSSDDARNYSPASCREAFTVAATGPDGYPASYTNVGAGVDIAAPGGDSNYAPDDSDESGLAVYPGCPFGEARLGWSYGHPSWIDVASPWCRVWTDYTVEGGIISTISSASLDFDGQYTWALYEGTSMAAPHVSAVAALVAGKYPTLTPAKIEAALTQGSRPHPARAESGYDNMGADAFFEDYVLGYADVYEEDYGYPDKDAGDAVWTAFFEEDLAGASAGFTEAFFGCTTTSAVGVMGNEIYGTDLCATDWDGMTYWQVMGWANSNSHDGALWNYPIFNPYSVSSGNDCNELGCGTGTLSASGALARARLLARTR